MKSRDGNSTSCLRLVIILLLAHPCADPVFAQEEVDGEQEPQWNVSASGRYLRKFTRYGVDLSSDPAFSLGADLSHSKGFSLGVETFYGLGVDRGLQRWSWGAGYEYAVSELVTLSAEYAHQSYTNATLNALASLSNSVSLGADLDFEEASVSFSYDIYFGEGSASFFGAGFSSFYRVGTLTALPVVQTTFVSQTVNDQFIRSKKDSVLAKKKQQGPQAAQSTTSVTGLSNISVLVVFGYPLVEGFSFSFTPSLIYSPSELSSRSFQFVWLGAIRFSKDF